MAPRDAKLDVHLGLWSGQVALHPPQLLRSPPILLACPPQAAETQEIELLRNKITTLGQSHAWGFVAVCLTSKGLMYCCTVFFMKHRPVPRMMVDSCLGEHLGVHVPIDFKVCPSSNGLVTLSLIHI